MKKSAAILFLSFLIMSYQVVPVSLRVTVRDEVGNIVQGAKVTIYQSEEDYSQNQNQVGDAQTTDRRGNAIFRNLETIPYYVRAEKGEMNNEERGIKTDTLNRARQNQVTIIVD
ncbi:MAG: carboxypeptidase-like regulatory domain-containing protein [Cytophagaceae bacterium]